MSVMRISNNVGRPHSKSHDTLHHQVHWWLKVVAAPGDPAATDAAHVATAVTPAIVAFDAADVADVAVADVSPPVPIQTPTRDPTTQSTRQTTDVSSTTALPHPIAQATNAAITSVAQQVREMLSKAHHESSKIVRPSHHSPPTLLPQQ